MRFKKITLELLLGELAELPTEWMDDVAARLVGELRVSVQQLRDLGRPITVNDVEEKLLDNPRFIDVARLFLGKGQEPVAHMLCESLQARSMTWSGLRGLAKREPGRLAEAFGELGLAESINEQLGRKWEVEDILIERYRMGRGRAIAGQKRGRALEDEVEGVLNASKIAFHRGSTFVGRKNKRAKCDFAIPTEDHPKIVIEAKGFEATGSKLTDFLGDVMKIVRAKEYQMYFFLVTDGRGWHNRVSDLKKLVEYQQHGDVDMIYTRSRLDELSLDVKRICSQEL